MGARLHAGHAGRRSRVPHAERPGAGNRECLAIEVGFSLPTRRVIALLDQLIAFREAPAALRLDNGPEFVALRLSDWADHHGILLNSIQPGQPVQNAFIERFNQTDRTEVLDAQVFRSLAEARALTADWLRRYNTERPHDSLGSLPPLTLLPRPTSIRAYRLQMST